MPAQTHCDTLLRAGYLITQDDDRRTIRDAGVAITSGRIAAVGPWSEISAAYEGSLLDLSGEMVMPGLINCHTHAAMTAFRGLADDLPLMRWLEGHIWPVEKKLTKEIVFAASRIACAEMLRSGTTCFADMYFHQFETARAVRETGMRCMLGEGILGFPTRSYDTPQQALELANNLAGSVADTERIRVCIPPHAVYTTDADLLQMSFAEAERLNTPWMIHASENAEECERSVQMFGKRPIPYLYELGCLSPRTVLVHCVDLTDEEILMIAESGASVAHNPRSNMKLASGVARVADLSDAGVNICLGTDGAASNNALNMFREMKVCALLQKVTTGDPTVAPAQKVLDMATVNGAKALGWQDTGSIKLGNIADIIALSLDEPTLCPVYTPVSHTVYAAGGHEVRMTMVEGEVLFDHGEFSNFDVEELRADARNIEKWIGR